MSHSVRIGISGWTYEPWRKTFYPPKLSHKKELGFASRQVNSIEVNGLFYSLQKPPSFVRWFEEVPDDFVFAVKANRFITHIKKLRDVGEPLANFFASGLLALGSKMGPVLWQFPPNMPYNEELFEAFLKQLPHDFKSAAKLGRRHGAKVKGRSYFPPRGSKNFKIRHAVEVRHQSFENAAFQKLLRRYNVALVTADSAGKFPFFDKPTADFVYLRLHGAKEIYASGYSTQALKVWAKKINAWKKRRDVYVYFDNDIKVQAPFNAVDLLKLCVKDFAPAAPMKKAAVKNLKTPGPRLIKDDRRW